MVLGAICCVSCLDTWKHEHAYHEGQRKSHHDASKHVLPQGWQSNTLQQSGLILKSEEMLEPIEITYLLPIKITYLLPASYLNVLFLVSCSLL